MTKTDPGVAAWVASAPGAAMYLSVLVLGELRRGIELVRRRDTRAANRLERWRDAIAASHSGRIVGIDFPSKDMGDDLFQRHG